MVDVLQIVVCKDNTILDTMNSFCTICSFICYPFHSHGIPNNLLDAGTKIENKVAWFLSHEVNILFGNIEDKYINCVKFCKKNKEISVLK